MFFLSDLIKADLSMNVLFSGIGCQERGFENSILFNINVVNVSEINKEAVLSYAAIHCGLTPEMVDTYTDYPSKEEMARQLTEINLGYNSEKNKAYDWHKLSQRKSNDINKYWLANKLVHNLGDINKIEFLPYADLWTISFCCQDISVAGKMRGLKPDSGTRSSLLWENIRLLKRAKDDGTLPKYLMFENVKNLVSKKFIDDFNSLLEVLDELGFNSYWKVLNAKDCGVPQNRERVFVISIRKDIDNGTYDFPKPFDTGIRLKDVLDKEVDEKYYLSKDIQERFHITDSTFTKNIVGTTKPDFRTIGQRDLVYQQDSIMGTLVATDYKQPKQIVEQIPMDKSLKNTRYGMDYSNCITAREDCGSSPYYAQQGTAVLELTNNCIQAGDLNHYNYDEMNRVYSKEGCCPTLRTMQGGDRQPRVLEQNDKLTHSEWKEQMYKQFIKDANGEPSGVLTNQSQTFGCRPPMKGYSKCLRSEANDTGVVQNFRVRKLTPNECWKLMGLTEKDCTNAKNIGVADSQLYKQAGNGIVTNCVELLAEHLYKAQYDNTYKCTDENF